MQARLTVIINTALVNMMDLDHRIVPWDTVRSRAVLVSMLHQDEVTWTRDPSRDILVWPGHTATITAYPHLTNNIGAIPNMVNCRSQPFPYPGKQSYSRSGCRNTVMQMIAEKSVNCSMMSLPPTPGTDLPTCGPLEGLALMYILKEQGDLVVQNPDIRNKFERNLQEKCPYECELKYWKADVISSEVEGKVAAAYYYYYFFFFTNFNILNLRWLHSSALRRKKSPSLSSITATTSLLRPCSTSQDSWSWLTD